MLWVGNDGNNYSDWTWAHEKHTASIVFNYKYF